MDYTHSDLQTIIDTAETDGHEWQKRRHPEWRENYTLFRNKVKINRFTQRQSVNIPLMKRGIKTLIANYKAPPDLYFENLSNDQQKELYMNEQWKADAKDNSLETLDIIDKRQAALYGRSFKKLNVVNGKIKITIVDPQNVKLSRFTDPVSLESSYFLEHHSIFKTLGDIAQDSKYDKQAVKRLKEYYASEKGLIQAQENAESKSAQEDRMGELGAPVLDSVEVGVIIAELKEFYIKLFNKETNEDEYYLIIASPVAEDHEILMVEPLEEVIGETTDNYWRYNLPFESWATEPDKTDIWNDAPADSLRGSNKIANSMTSQTVENRALRNFGMNYYNSEVHRAGKNKQPFVPQAFIPGPGQWVPFPGNPNKDIMRVEVDDLSESLDELKFIIDVAEQTNNTSSIQQGVPENASMTLGEVEILNYNAKEVISIDLVDYHRSWHKFGEKYMKFIEATKNLLKPIIVAKKGYRGNMFTAKISPKDWLDEEGYQAVIKENVDRVKEMVSQLTRLKAVRAEMPNNKALEKIVQRKLLELGGLNPEEKREVMDFQDKLDKEGNTEPNILKNLNLGQQKTAQIPAKLPTSSVALQG